jgi:hypothetical protein
MRIGICLNEITYSAEAYAYATYLTLNGFTVEVGLEESLSNTIELKLQFPGFIPPFDKIGAKSSILEVHDYASLSVPPFSKLKNFLKSHLNSKPDARIFLNSQVEGFFDFNDDIPFLYRDMGVDEGFLEKTAKLPEYDVIYCGFSHNGLLGVLKRLCELNLKVLVVGEISRNFRSSFSPNDDITFSGRVKRKYLPELYHSCRVGLNYTPDIYPFNIQTSTKTLEYCAAGLGVISNKYSWVDRFTKSRAAKFLWLDNVFSSSQVRNFDYVIPDVSDLERNKMLTKISFANFLKSLKG